MKDQIIRSQAEVNGAPMNVLVNTYNALTGNSIKKFENRAVAESRVANAIMSAQDAAGHLGVPKGMAAPCLTVEERAAKAAANGTNGSKPADAEKTPENVPIQPAAKKAKAKPTGKPRKVIDSVRATNAGTSKPQADSVRGKVLKFIQDAPGKTASMAELEAKFGEAARGCVMKLLEKNHLETL